jgi:hypothetical protein
MLEEPVLDAQLVMGDAVARELRYGSTWKA